MKVTPMPPPAIQNPVVPPKCLTVDQPDGGVQVKFLIEPDVAKRLKLRANGMPLEMFLWENILKRAVTDYVY